jgi:hypothetical protein
MQRVVAAAAGQGHQEQTGNFHQFGQMLKHSWQSVQVTSAQPGCPTRPGGSPPQSVMLAQCWHGVRAVCPKLDSRWRRSLSEMPLATIVHMTQKEEARDRRCSKRGLVPEGEVCRNAPSGDETVLHWLPATSQRCLGTGEPGVAVAGRYHPETDSMAGTVVLLRPMQTMTNSTRRLDLGRQLLALSEMMRWTQETGQYERLQGL